MSKSKPTSWPAQNFAQTTCNRSEGTFEGDQSSGRRETGIGRTHEVCCSQRQNQLTETTCWEGPRVSASNGVRRTYCCKAFLQAFLLFVICALLPSCSLASRATPRVAIVSEKAFHLEVLAGFISILEKDFGKHLTVYMHPLNFENRHLDFGFAEFLQSSVHRKIRALPWMGVPQFDAVIFISPEYRPKYVQEFIERSRTKLVIMMVHNGDAVGVLDLPAMHQNAHLMTLSPHVQQFVAARLNMTVDWMLPLKSLKARNDCPEDELATCLSGFAIQGAMDSRRRNYGAIFSELDNLIGSSEEHRKDTRLKINVVGSGKPEKLGVPSHLSGRVIPHTNLRFQDFYELIHSNLALLPALASDAYYDRKFSSTLITSLVTSVPVVVDDRFLASYTFLSDKHVIKQAQAGDTTDAMTRLLAASSSELAAVRRAVGELREELSRQALNKIKNLLKTVEADIQKEFDEQPW